MYTTTISTNLERIRARIRAAARRAGRDPAGIRLMAVSKKMEAGRLREAVAAGQRLFGENYVQEAEVKIKRLRDLTAADRPVLHLIGHLQSNKAKTAAVLFDCIQTVDRLKLARALEKHLAAADRTMPVLIQVNVGGEAAKSGVSPGNCASLLAAMEELPHLRVRGLMTMPPYFADPEQVRPYFRRLRRLATELTADGRLGGAGPVELSMGMSNDFEVAVEEGATLIRIGTAIFGDRPQH